jgi:hypothetical protein
MQAGFCCIEPTNQWKATKMANGICDIAGCQRKTYMGWRPLSEKMGRQVCEYHWCRHNDNSDNFNLFDTFDFPRLPVVQTGKSWHTNAESVLRRCICGTELPKGYQYCQKCAKERERKRKREYRHKKKEAKLESLASTPKENILRCKTENCERERKYGHSYCDKCAKQRMRERERIKKRKKRNMKMAGVPLFDPGETAILS